MKRTRLLGSVIATLLLMGFAYGPKVLVKVVDTNGDAVAHAIVTITDDASGEVLVAGAEANRGGVLRVDLDKGENDGHHRRSARDDHRGRRGRGRGHDREVLSLTVEAESPDGSMYGMTTAQIREEGHGTEVIRVVVEPAEVPTAGCLPNAMAFLSGGQLIILLDPLEGAYISPGDVLRLMPSGDVSSSVILVGDPVTGNALTAFVDFPPSSLGADSYIEVERAGVPIYCIDITW